MTSMTSTETTETMETPTAQSALSGLISAKISTLQAIQSNITGRQHNSVDSRSVSLASPIATGATAMEIAIAVEAGSSIGQYYIVAAEAKGEIGPVATALAIQEANIGTQLVNAIIAGQ